jgi:hypothetical protein
MPGGGEPQKALPPCGGGLGWGVTRRRTRRNKIGMIGPMRQSQHFTTPGRGSAEPRLRVSPREAPRPEIAQRAVRNRATRRSTGHAPRKEKPSAARKAPNSPNPNVAWPTLRRATKLPAEIILGLRSAKARSLAERRPTIRERYSRPLLKPYVGPIAWRTR